MAEWIARPHDMWEVYGLGPDLARVDSVGPLCASNIELPWADSTKIWQESISGSTKWSYGACGGEEGMHVPHIHPDICALWSNFLYMYLISLRDKIIITENLCEGFSSSTVCVSDM